LTGTSSSETTSASDVAAVSTRPHVIAIVGPTGSGKTALAEAVALVLEAEIVSADSMQVYRGMDIGTAKPPPESRTVPYHLLDVAEPGTPFSAALYQRLSREAIEDVASRGRKAIVCGGTGLYVRAALDDLRFPSGEQQSPVRGDLEVLAGEIGPEALHERLRAVDPDSAALIHPNNVRRTVRALEMAEEGVSYAQQAAGFAVRAAYFPATYLGLAMDRERLYERIDARVYAMLEAGLLDEVRHLLAQGFRLALTAQQAIGYKELVPVIEQDASLETAIEDVKRATRRYAKRQLTWFRADPRVMWLDVTELSPAEAVERALRLIESDAPRTS
jgi:tRNA dimethylallyltransferase